MDLKEIIKNNNATIVDVRTVEEYKNACIPEAINIPLNDVTEKVEEFKRLQKPIVVCCLSGGRSAQAVAFLAANGVEEIFNGGGWEELASLRQST